VRRRSMNNGDGTPQTPASGLPRNGRDGSYNGGAVPVGQGQPAAAQGGRGGQGGQGGPGGTLGQPGLPMPTSMPTSAPLRRGDDDSNLPSRQEPSTGAQPVARSGSRFSLSNWRVRWRLFAIIAVPTIAALILGVIQSVNAETNYNNFARVKDLATINSLVVTGVTDLTNERDTIAGYVAAGKPASQLGKVEAVENATDATVSEISQQAQGIVSNSAVRAQTVLDLRNGVLGGISDLDEIRDAALKTSYPSVAIVEVYDARLITPFITFSNDVAAGSGNSTLTTDVTVLNSLLRMEDDASLERAYLYQALDNSPPALTPEALIDLKQADAELQADTNQFTASASVAESQDYDNTVSGSLVDEAKSEELLAESSAANDNGQQVTIGQQQDCAGLTSANCWYNDQSAQLTDMRTVIGGSSGQAGLVGEIQSQATTLVSSAKNSALLISLITVLLLIIVILITVIVARSMIRPLRKLRADALEIAGTKLPEMVRRLSESEGGDDSVEIEPIGVSSTDEIGEVARAFDQVHREAVRLAADEAMLRGNLNAMFVNLSRRSQSLIERQLTLIDNLEQSEQDPDRLSSLFRLDHLATRMRRNSENLLVLAGHEGARKWSQAVPLVDVLRAAISEIEQYERVVLNVQPGIHVVGQAVNDVVHLVAEIVENATTFSPEDTQVYVTGQPLTSGGVLLDITDNGVGISEQEMAHANWRLDNPPVVDVAVSRRMGLFVVGRLAARHGVRVRLRHAQSGGLTALIWLPESVAAPESAQPLGRLRKFEADDYGPPPSLSAPTPAGAVGLGQQPFGLAGPGSGGPAIGGPGSGGPGPGSQGGPGFGVGAPGGPGAAGGAAGRMTRLAGGSNGSNGGNGFPAVGSGNGIGGVGSSSGTGPRNSFATDNGGFGADNGFGTDSGLRADSGPTPLPTRQPGGSQAGGSGLPARGRNGSGDYGSVSGAGDFAPPPAPQAQQSPSAPLAPQFGDGAFGADNGFGADSSFGDARFGDVPAGPSFSTGPNSVLGSGTSIGSRVTGSDGSSVAVPPSAASGIEHRLPIFDSLESDWFRRSGSSVGSTGPTASTASTAATTESWNSPADEGWRAAKVAATPNADETTTAGLPKRVPRANLVPGSVGGGEEPAAETPPPVRSADSIRNRMSSFQRGVREARAAAPQTEEP
jgi:signal transduction histidine kinase